ncbi:PREDICTED: corticosteroid-binding globulin isoform X1 [Hipposideros armiger]|uniref:Corticosteroid-binding globulin n=1 Tax=Hipposideros armiger TaxID=186990 RepID=A0A8B7RAG8_HIPAR|nr:PREDICTED: corticosteroid-binding globulin isoform X1 [Hipposideros armiger]
MLLALYTCILWLSTGGLWTVQAQDPTADVCMCMSNHHRDLAPNNVDFAFGLYKHLVASAPGKNVFLSPVSISMALAMLSLGARGDTRTQILQSLGFNLTETSEVGVHQSFWNLHQLLRESDTSLEMTMGNVLFINQSLELQDSFSADTKRYYELDALATDFQDLARASRQINEYIKNKTHGKIVDLFSELDSPAMLILVNYIFFKGTWAHPFDQESTREDNFYVNETTLVKVPMMFQSSEIKHLNDQVLPCQLVQLDYMGNGTVFFILPDKGKVDTVINALNRNTIQRWSDSLTSGHVDLYIPKVSISRAYDIGSLLEDMSIADLLYNQANFSGIAQGVQLKVSKVVHEAMLQLDEKGVMTAAPTAVPRNVTSEPLTIQFNRPFIVMIFDNFTWSSLFLVKVVNPT